MDQSIAYCEGVDLIEEWRDKVTEAQVQHTYLVSEKVYLRIKYGDEIELHRSEKPSCSDCAVIQGQYHVPGCDAEQCPACGHLVTACDCQYGGDTPLLDNPLF